MQKRIVSNQDKAVALKYDEEYGSAPHVVAKGQGDIAKQIRSVAKKNNIPIYQDSDLVELLAQIDIDREIPSKLYAAVAEILSWIYRANEATKKESRV